MKLVHYSDQPLGALLVREPGPERAFFKPRGLWLSDDDCDDNWRAWCVAEGFGLERLTHVHDVELLPDANVLILKSAADIRSFTREWTFEDPKLPSMMRVRWPDVMTAYDGLIITPYIWRMRLDMEAGWYYSWDCASGCIWQPRAVASVMLREVVPVPEPTQ